MQQGSQEWLEDRKKGIGSSDAPIILGISPWSTPYKLWQEKLGYKEPSEQTYAMKRGTLLEEDARKAYEKYTNEVVFPKCVIHPEFDYLKASLDGITLEQDLIVEIKVPGKQTREAAEAGQIEPHYFAQVQHQLLVTGCDMAHFWVWHPDEGGHLVEVSRDDQYIDTLLVSEHRFWKCVQDMEPPKLLDRDYEIKDDATWKQACLEYRRLEERLSKLNQEKENLRKQIIDMADGRNVQGAGVRLTRFLRKGSINYKTIPELSCIDLNQYRSPATECWKITTEG